MTNAAQSKGEVTIPSQLQEVFLVPREPGPTQRIALADKADLERVDGNKVKFVYGWILKDGELLAVASEFKGKEPDDYVVTHTMWNRPLPNEVVVTFSRRAWQGTYPPMKSQMVILTGVQAFRGGWRAYSARPILFSDAVFGTKEELDQQPAGLPVKSD